MLGPSVVRPKIGPYKYQIGPYVNAIGPYMISRNGPPVEILCRNPTGPIRFYHIEIYLYMNMQYMYTPFRYGGYISTPGLGTTMTRDYWKLERRIGGGWKE